VLGKRTRRSFNVNHRRNVQKPVCCYINPAETASERGPVVAGTRKSGRYGDVTFHHTDAGLTFLISTDAIEINHPIDERGGVVRPLELESEFVTLACHSELENYTSTNSVDMRVLDLAEGDDSTLPSLKIKLKDSDQKYPLFADEKEEILETFPCPIHFIFVVELIITAKPKRQYRYHHFQPKEFRYTMPWNKPIRAAMPSHADIVATLFNGRFKKERQTSYMIDARNALNLLNPNPSIPNANQDYIKDYDVSQMVEVHLCASFGETGGGEVTQPYLTVFLFLLSYVSRSSLIFRRLNLKKITRTCFLILPKYHGARLILQYSTSLLK
jgi:hypothetical protein